jgi:hypothetical protein
MKLDIDDRDAKPLEAMLRRAVINDETAYDETAPRMDVITCRAERVAALVILRMLEDQAAPSAGKPGAS